MQCLKPSRTAEGVSPRSFNDFEKSSRVKVFLGTFSKGVIDIDTLHTLGSVEQRKRCQRQRIVAVLLDIRQLHEELIERH